MAVRTNNREVINRAGNLSLHLARVVIVGIIALIACNCTKPTLPAKTSELVVFSTIQDGKSYYPVAVKPRPLTVLDLRSSKRVELDFPAELEAENSAHKAVTFARSGSVSLVQYLGGSGYYRTQRVGEWTKLPQQISDLGSIFLTPSGIQAKTANGFISIRADGSCEVFSGFGEVLLSNEAAIFSINDRYTVTYVDGDLESISDERKRPFHDKTSILLGKSLLTYSKDGLYSTDLRTRAERKLLPESDYALTKNEEYALITDLRSRRKYLWDGKQISTVSGQHAISVLVSGSSDRIIALGNFRLSGFKVFEVVRETSTSFKLNQIENSTLTATPFSTGNTTSFKAIGDSLFVVDIDGKFEVIPLD